MDALVFLSISVDCTNILPSIIYIYLVLDAPVLNNQEKQITNPKIVDSSPLRNIPTVGDFPLKNIPTVGDSPLRNIPTLGGRKDILAKVPRFENRDNYHLILSAYYL